VSAAKRVRVRQRAVKVKKRYNRYESLDLVMNTSIEMQTDKPIPSTSREMPDAILVESNANDTLVSAPTVIDDREWGVE